MIYLDNAATSWPKPTEVYENVNHCLKNLGANPGRGGHRMALSAAGVLYEAREEIAGLLNIPDPNRIAFSLNATDALNTAIFGILKPGDTVITTSMEHNSVARPLTYLKKQGVNLKIIPCNQEGHLNFSAMAEALALKPKAAVITHASNVTGAIMPIAEIGQLAKKYNTILIVDAAQTVGIEEINFSDMNIDVLAASGHKGLLGPQGTGIIVLREGLTITPFRFGGTGSKSESEEQPEFMPDLLESGTANTPGIAGLLAGVLFIKNTGLKKIRDREKELSEELAAGLSGIPGVKLYRSKNFDAHTAVVSFTLAETDSSLVAGLLESNHNIICRAGLHCAPWAHKTIGTIKTGAIRFSPGFFNTPSDIRATVKAVEAVKSIKNRPRKNLAQDYGL